MTGPYLIVIPTYNELVNIQEVIPRILGLPHPLHVLVVDDNSPDGTGALVERMADSDPRIHCLHRPGKAGLGSAYIAGLRWALAREYTVIFEMDADLSHDPGAIPEFLKAIEDADVVLGSRYLRGVTVINWPLRRRPRPSKPLRCRQPRRRRQWRLSRRRYGPHKLPPPAC